MRIPFFAVAAALAVWFPAALALAQSTPTPTPPLPAVTPIPSFPEKAATPAATPAPTAAVPGPAAPTPTPDNQPVSFDRAGMFGAGIALGNNFTGATGKFWAADNVALQFGVGGGSVGNDLRLQLDVLFRYFRWVSADGQYALPFYLGLGGQAGIYSKNPSPANRTDLGVRLPLGMSVTIPNNPVELFFEIAPDMGVYNDTVYDKERPIFYVDGNLGVRYYF